MFLSKRNGTYYVFYENERDKRTCISTKTKLKSDANKFLIDFRDEIEKRESQKIIPTNIRDFANQFRSHSALIHSYHTGKDYQSVFNIIKKEFGNIHLTDLTENVISNYLKKRNQISIYTSAKDLRYFRSTFNWAVKWKYFVANSCSNIKSIKPPEKQPLFFNLNDYQVLLESIDNQDL